MKRIISVLLAVLMICSFVLAESSLQTDETRYIAVKDDDDVVVYAFAKVSNISDAATRVKDGYLVVAEGESAEDTDTFSANMAYLLPGEYTYTRFKLKTKNIDEVSEITNMLMTFEEGEVKDHVVTYYTAEGTYNADDECMYARVTNNTQEDVYGINVTFALKDSSGSLLYVDSSNLLSTIGVEPGSTISVKCRIPDAIGDYFKENGMTPASVEAAAYTIEKVESDD